MFKREIVTEIPEIAGPIERAAFLASIPARGQGRNTTPEQRKAWADVQMYRQARARRYLGRH